jgi:hypothetical protein
MSAAITLTLPDTVLECAQLWAERSGQPLTDFLTETIELSLVPLGHAPPPVTEWANGEVLSAAESQLPFADDQRLSDLLACQREGRLSEPEATELHRLMLMYQEGLLRKAMALREAVRRGLREPPEP